MKRLFPLLLALLFGASLTSFFLVRKSKQDFPYKNPTLSIEERINDLLGRMTLEEKIEQLSGLGFDSKVNTRLGIPALKMADGPLGVRNGKATAFPAGVALGATWDTVLINKVGVALGKETRAKGLNYLLGPCVNIHRLPIGGRNFESFGEDPYLSSRLTVNYIKGLQSQNVISSVKHFACNDQEWERMRYDVQVDERTLREIHFPMFKAAVEEAGVWSVMGCYNKVNGKYASENKYLLNDVLKGDWGFKGFVVSDWEATHSCVPSAQAGLDLEMPVGTYFGDSLLTAVKSGLVSEEIINDKVRRILRIKFKAGLFDEANVKPDTTILHSAEHQKLALDAARNSMVLLKNNNILPLDRAKIKSIAIIGPNAAVARTGGGGSSMVTPYSAISPLEGVKAKVGKNVKVNYAIGDELDIKGIKIIESKYLLPSNPAAKGNGLWGEYFEGVKLEGKPVVSRLDKELGFDYEQGSPDPKLYKDGWSTRWTGKLKAPTTRKYTIFTEGDDGVRMWFDNKLVIDNWDVHGTERDSFFVDLVANKTYDVKIEYFEGNMGAVFRLGWDLPAPGETNVDKIQEAVKAAQLSDVAIIFVGFSHQYEAEGHDRKGGLSLPRKQNELIQAVAKANPKTIVVLNNGSPVAMGAWLDNVAGVIEAWYPGQAAGEAMADIIFGDFNPSGKLPVTFVKKEEDAFAYKGYKNPDLKVKYDEGVFVGYRYYDKNNIEPLFPFGYGLSYTQFDYSNLNVKNLPNGKVEVSVSVKNSGKRSGAEVVQLYVKDKESSVPRPERELKGFSKVTLQPGEQKTITMVLDKDAFSFYDVNQKKFVVEPGDFEIHVGSSSRDIRLKSPLKL